MSSTDKLELAVLVREACIQTALSAYEDASISGLCGEGAFEAAVSAMRMMNLEMVLKESSVEQGGGW